jgi:hypothetical protein
MDTGTSGFPQDDFPGDIRVSDADRDQAVAELSEHFQTGRLTQDEFDDRSGQALRARTGADLNQLFTDLPRRPVAPAPPADQDGPFPADYGAPRPVRQVPVGRLVITAIIVSIIFSNVLSIGHAGFGWLVPVVVLAFVFLRIGAGHRRR